MQDRAVFPADRSFPMDAFYGNLLRGLLIYVQKEPLSQVDASPPGQAEGQGLVPPYVKLSTIIGIG